MKGILYLVFGVIFILMYKYLISNISYAFMKKVRKEIIKDFKIDARRVKHILKNQEKVYYECPIKNLYVILKKEDNGYSVTNPSNGKYVSVDEEYFINFVCDSIKYRVADAYTIEALYLYPASFNAYKASIV